MNNDPTAIREALEAAATDLLEGRATGPLTGVRLAELAGVKRHRLTHDNADLNREFQRRAAELNRSKPEVDRLREQLRHERERNSRLVAENQDLHDQLNNYAAALLSVVEERDALLALPSRNLSKLPSR